MGPKSILKLTTALAFSGAFEGLVSAGTIQLPGLTVPASAKTNAHHVREIFKRSYKAYHKYAFGHDDLAPLSESFYDGRNGVIFGV
jgi:mannosyl-oligosaccharide alpha-1,2-mannosidase